MLRLIVILVLLIYLVNKVGGFLFRVLGHSQRTPPNFRPPGDANVNMDSPPKKTNRKSGIKGGDYVDYEEVK